MLGQLDDAGQVGRLDKGVDPGVAVLQGRDLGMWPVDIEKAVGRPLFLFPSSKRG